MYDGIQGNSKSIDSLNVILLKHQCLYVIRVSMTDGIN